MDPKKGPVVDVIDFASNRSSVGTLKGLYRDVKDNKENRFLLTLLNLL